MSDKNLVMAWAEKLFNDHEISCIPIAKDAKRPLIQTSQWWGKHVPISLIERYDCNLAVQTGTVNRLLVIDVDNPAKASSWFCQHPPLPSTWSVRTGGGGLHLYFRQPRWWDRSIPKTRLWVGDQKHEEVLCLGDRAMAICPPSKIGANKQYKFEFGLNPLQTKIAYAPPWLLKEVVDHSSPAKLPAVESASSDPWVFPVRGRRIETGELLDQIPDKLSHLVQWGLRLAGDRPNASGWMPAHRPGDRDECPSASVRPDSGSVWTSTHGVMSFFEASVALGAFADVQSAIGHFKGQIDG